MGRGINLANIKKPKIRAMYYTALKESDCTVYSDTSMMCCLPSINSPEQSPS